MRSKTVSRGVGSGERTSEGDDGLSRDAVFDILSNERRRHALHYLKHREGAVTVGELAETLAAWEAGTATDAVTSKDRKRVYTSLYQSHLPRMDRAGVVTYDQRSGTVELTPEAAELDIYLEVVQRNDIPWSEFYLGLSGIFAALVTALWVDVYPFTLLPDFLWIGGFAVLFVGCSAVHTFVDGRRRIGVTAVPPDIRRDGGNEGGERT